MESRRDRQVVSPVDRRKEIDGRRCPRNDERQTCRVLKNCSLRLRDPALRGCLDMLQVLVIADCIIPMRLHAFGLDGLSSYAQLIANTTAHYSEKEEGE